MTVYCNANIKNNTEIKLQTCFLSAALSASPFFRGQPQPFFRFLYGFYYIIPPIPPPAGIAGASSLIFATTDSVVSRVDATLVAF